MKRCPECRRDYYDDTLLYCLDDGNALLDGPARTESEPGGRFDEPQTSIMRETPVPSEAATRPQIHATDEVLTKSSGERSGNKSFSAGRAGGRRTTGEVCGDLRLYSLSLRF